MQTSNDLDEMLLEHEDFGDTLLDDDTPRNI
jgi:hypothetical protein